jgi:hypothetical protein
VIAVPGKSLYSKRLSYIKCKYFVIGPTINCTFDWQLYYWYHPLPLVWRFPWQFLSLGFFQGCPLLIPFELPIAEEWLIVVGMKTKKCCTHLSVLKLCVECCIKSFCQWVPIDTDLWQILLCNGGTACPVGGALFI